MTTEEYEKCPLRISKKLNLIKEAALAYDNSLTYQDIMTNLESRQTFYRFIIAYCMKSGKGTINPKQISDYIEMEFEDWAI